MKVTKKDSIINRNKAETAVTTHKKSYLLAMR